MTSRPWGVSIGVAAAVVALSGWAQAGSPGFADLRREFPGAQRLGDAHGLVSIFGVPMTGGETPDAAVQAWLGAHADALGAGVPELVVHRVNDISFGKFTGYAFTQAMDGVPVEFAGARVLVHNGLNRVVLVTSRLASRPAHGFRPDRVSASSAVLAVRAMPEHAGLTDWTAPELVVFAGADAINGEAVRAWKFTGDNLDLAHRERRTFYVDLATGDVVHVHEEIRHTDVTGQVNGKGTPGTNPDSATNPPVVMAMPEIRVAITGGGSAYTSRAGAYTIAHGGTSAVTVTTSVGPSSGAGRWVHVDNVAGSEMSLSQSVTPPGPANFEFNSAPSELTTAQVNAFIHTNEIHNYIKDRAPTWTYFDTSFRANVNISSTCNAYYDGGSINFYRSGGGCPNTAYTSVVAHEYGHHVCSDIYPPQGAFGEGYGDLCGMLIYDDPIVGRDFFGPGSHLRDADNANMQYPCGGPIHTCGMVLSGAWWEIRKAFGNTYGSAAGLDLVRQLHIDWSQITIGGSGGDSAHPTTAVEVLTIDDDNGDLSDGTPNFVEICSSFAQHGIDCPGYVLFDFTWPDGVPGTFSPTAGTTVDVVIEPVYGTPVPESAAFVYRVDGGAFTSIAMTALGDDLYRAEVPPIACGSLVDFYVRMDDPSGAVGTDPDNAPGDAVHSAIGGVSGGVIDEEDFQDAPGWSVTNSGVSDGAWATGTPSGGTNAPTTDADGSGRCFLTGPLFGRDLDGGPTRLLSPIYDLSAYERARVWYSRWMRSTGGTADQMTVQVSNDGGTTWKKIEDADGFIPVWFNEEWEVTDFVALTSAVRFRVLVSDNPNDSTAEAGFDAFRLMAFTCTEDCYADCDANGTLNSLDVLCYLNLFSSGDPAADCDANGALNSLDLLCYLNAFNEGCP